MESHASISFAVVVSEILSAGLSKTSRKAGCVDFGVKTVACEKSFEQRDDVLSRGVREQGEPHALTVTRNLALSCLEQGGAVEFRAVVLQHKSNFRRLRTPRTGEPAAKNRTEWIDSQRRRYPGLFRRPYVKKNGMGDMGSNPRRPAFRKFTVDCLCKRRTR